MKQFVKALDRSGPCFQYLNIKFLALSEAEVKEGIIDGQQNSKAHERSRIHEYNERRRTSGIECIHRSCQEVPRGCERSSL